nr:unnamed protein product [Callosobruchus chinensis]
MDVKGRIGSSSEGSENLGQGKMSEPTAFKRSSLLQHSPPHRGRTGSLPSIKGFAERQEARKQQLDSQPLPKRKREGSPIANQSVTEEESAEQALKDFLRNVSDTANNLKNLIKIIPNTKADIKNGILEINRQIELLDRKGISFKVANKTTEKVSPAKKQSRSIGVQVDIAPSDKGSTEKDAELSQIEKVLSEGKGFQELGKVMDLQWPDAVFKVVGLEKANPIKTAQSADSAILLDPRDKGEKGLVKLAMDAFPEIADLASEGLIEGQLDYVVNNTRTASSRSEAKKERSTYIFLLPCNIDKNGVNDLGVIYTLLLQCRDKMVSENRNKICFAVSGGLDLQYMRKMAEFVFSTMSVEVKLIIPPGYQGNITDTKKVLEKQKSRPREAELGTVIVKADGRQYADLLKDVKGKVGQHTNEGDLIIKTEGGRVAAAQLKETIINGIEGIHVRATGGTRRKILHIMGADAITTMEDVADAIKVATKVSDEAFVVRSARLAYGETQNFTIEVQEGVAECLLAARTLRIGLLNCEVRERVNLIRCFRCKNFGHMQAQCNGPDRTDSCLRCGEKGHIIKDCPEGSKEYCFSCKNEGHSNNTMKCPAYRRLLNDQRRRSHHN